MKKANKNFKRARLIAVRALNDYVYYLQSKKVIIFNNLLAGLMRGVGSAIGFWLISAIILALFSILSDNGINFPDSLIGIDK